MPVKNYVSGNTRDATEIIRAAFGADPGKIALAVRDYRSGFRVELPYGSIAQLGLDYCAYWPPVTRKRETPLRGLQESGQLSDEVFADAARLNHLYDLDIERYGHVAAWNRERFALGPCTRGDHAWSPDHA